MLKCTPKLYNSWLDWNHPLNAKLQTCLLFQEGRGNSSKNYVTTGVDATASDPAWILNRDIYGIHTSGDKNFALPNTGNIAAGDVAIRIRFYPLTIPSSSVVLVDKSLSNLTRELFIAIDSDGTTGNISLGRGNATPELTTGITANNLYDLVLTRSGTTCTLYINSISLGTFTISGVTASAADLLIGAGIPSVALPCFDGYFHSLEIWTRNLIQEEVQALYYKGIDPVRFIHPSRPKFFLPSDSLSLAETIGITKSLKKVVSETLTLVETQARTGTYNLDVQEEVYHNETFVRGSVINISVVEGVALNSNSGNRKATTASDTLSLSENARNGKWINESIEFDEVVTNNNSKLTIEDISFDESISMTKTKNLSISENIDVADTGIPYFATTTELNSGQNDFGSEVG